MSNSYAAIADPFLQEAGPSKARCSGKAHVVGLLLVGLGFAALVIGGSRGAIAPQKAITTMALPSVGLRPVKGSQMRPVNAWTQSMQMHGIQTGPMENLAIAAIEATNRGHGMRDVAAMAAKMDSKTRSKLTAMGSSAKLKVEDMAGVTAPLGFFDPLGFSTQLSEGKLLFYREVELKHGRIGMLASLGFLVGENFHPLFGGNIDSPALTAFQETPLQTFWPAVVTAIAIPELFSVFTFNEPAWKQTADTEFWSIKSDHTPGDLGFDPLGLKPTDPAEFKEMQTKELNNGRLAMIAAAGMIAQELVTGKKLF